VVASIRSAGTADDAAKSRFIRFFLDKGLPSAAFWVAGTSNCKHRFLRNTSCTGVRESILVLWLLRILPAPPASRAFAIWICRAPLPETCTKLSHYRNSGVQLESALSATEILHNELFATLSHLMTNPSNTPRSKFSSVCFCRVRLAP
jgi:hypothetical protein